MKGVLEHARSPGEVPVTDLSFGAELGGGAISHADHLAGPTAADFVEKLSAGDCGGGGMRVSSTENDGGGEASGRENKPRAKVTNLHNDSQDIESTEKAATTGLGENHADFGEGNDGRVAEWRLTGRGEF